MSDRDTRREVKGRLAFARPTTVETTDALRTVRSTGRRRRLQARLGAGAGVLVFGAAAVLAASWPNESNRLETEAAQPSSSAPAAVADQAPGSATDVEGSNDAVSPAREGLAACPAPDNPAFALPSNVVVVDIARNAIILGDTAATVDQCLESALREPGIASAVVLADHETVALADRAGLYVLRPDAPLRTLTYELRVEPSIAPVAHLIPSDDPALLWIVEPAQSATAASTLIRLVNVDTDEIIVDVEIRGPAWPVGGVAVGLVVRGADAAAILVDERGNVTELSQEVPVAAGGYQVVLRDEAGQLALLDLTSGLSEPIGSESTGLGFVLEPDDPTFLTWTAPWNNAGDILTTMSTPEGTELLVLVADEAEPRALFSARFFIAAWWGPRGDQVVVASREDGEVVLSVLDVSTGASLSTSKLPATYRVIGTMQE